MLADANAPVILTQEALREKLPPTPAKVICLDSGWKSSNAESEARTGQWRYRRQSGLC